MSLKVEVIKNTFFQIIARFATSLTALVVSAIITRVLGVGLYGEYSIVTTYTTAFFLLADFGINAIVLRGLESPSDIKFEFKKVLTLKVMFGLVSSIVAFAVLPLFNYHAAVKNSIMIAIPVILLSSLTGAATMVFQAKSKYSKLATATILSSLVVLAGFSIYVFLGNKDLVGLSKVYVISAILLPVISMALVLEDVSFSGKWVDLNYLKNTVRQALPFGMVLVINTMMIQADRFIISVYSPAESMAYYTTAYRLFDLVLVLPTFAMNSLYPSLLTAFSDDFAYFKKIMSKTLTYLFVGGVIASAITFLLSGPIVTFIWGSEMYKASVALNILMSGAVLFFLTSPLSWALLVKGYEKAMFVIYSIGFVFNLVANIIFVPKYDYIAAGVTTVLTEGLILISLGVIYFYSMRKISQSSQI